MHSSPWVPLTCVRPRSIERVSIDTIAIHPPFDLLRRNDFVSYREIQVPLVRLSHPPVLSLPDDGLHLGLPDVPPYVPLHQLSLELYFAAVVRGGIKQGNQHIRTWL